VALALGVAHPQASGIGGGGFALVYVAKEKKVYALDFRETAPAALRPESFRRDGKVDPTLSKEGGLAVGVPGEVKGLATLVSRWGKLPFGRCVAPAEKLARDGVTISWVLEDVTRVLAKPRETDDKGPPTPPADPLFQKAFGQPLTAGERLRRPELARTLALLRRRGPDAFYRGPVAHAIVDAVRRMGGLMTEADLAGYRVKERTPLSVSFRDKEVWVMPPPSSGGIALAETLGILSARYPTAEALPPGGLGSSAYLQILAEAEKHAFADRARHLGDPDFVDVPSALLLDGSYHRELAKRIKDDGVLPPEQYGTGGPVLRPPRDGGTAHLSVVDAEGNAVALTTTVNLWFGAKLIAGDTGIVLNDEMDDFSLDPAVANGFGLLGSAQNAPAGGKRPLSSMSPTIVRDTNGVVLVVGAAGGPTIISATLQVILQMLEGKKDVQAAIAAPRLHDQWSPAVLSVEPEFGFDVLENLKKRGQILREAGHIGKANAVSRAPDGRGWDAAAEPRSASTPAGY
jgi:gamma-glutamyltranspeptidase/glutathione hydrolase